MRKTVFVMFCVAFTVLLAALVFAGVTPTRCIATGTDVECDHHGLVAFLLTVVVVGVGVAAIAIAAPEEK